MHYGSCFDRVLFAPRRRWMRKGKGQGFSLVTIQLVDRVTSLSKTRGTSRVGQKIIDFSWVGSGRVGSGRVGSGRVGSRGYQTLMGRDRSPCSDPTRAKRSYT